MSVLIKDMEKPKSCYAVIDGEPEYCPFVNPDDNCVLLLKKGIICEGTWADQYSKCPLVEEPERKNGEWIYHTYMPHKKYCSACGHDSPYDRMWKYCPHCGSYNGGEQE